MKILFWISLFGAFYSYYIYPILLMIMPKRRRCLDDSMEAEPFMNLIITAHNVTSRITEKIKNTLLLNGLILCGAMAEKYRAKVFVRIPINFVELNIAIAHATIDFLFGKRIVTWVPTKR